MVASCRNGLRCPNQERPALVTALAARPQTSLSLIGSHTPPSICVLVPFSSTFPMYRCQWGVLNEWHNLTYVFDTNCYEKSGLGSETVKIKGDYLGGRRSPRLGVSRMSAVKPGRSENAPGSWLEKPRGHWCHLPGPEAGRGRAARNLCVWEEAWGLWVEDTPLRGWGTETELKAKKSPEWNWTSVFFFNHKTTYHRILLIIIKQNNFI